MKTKYVTFQSMKGGVGKSTIALILANFLHEQGKRVLVLDSDIQKTIVDCRQDDDELTGTAGKEKFEIIPFVSPDPGTFHAFLVTKDGQYDYILIDTPGRMDGREKEFLVTISDFIIVPILAEKKVIKTTKKFLMAVADTIADKPIVVLGVPNFRDNTVEQRQIIGLDGYAGMKLLKSGLSRRAIYKRDVSTIGSPKNHETYGLYDEICEQFEPVTVN